MRFRGTAIFLFVVMLSLESAPGSPQDMIRSGTGVGQEKTRIALPSFRVTPDSAELMKAFDDTLWNDLDNSGIIELVSKSFYPQQQPATPAEVFRTEMQKPPRGRSEIPVRVSDWARPPANAHMVALGNGNVNGQQLTIQGWLVDPGNAEHPEVFGKQYQEEATKDGARLAAHKFADEIIFRPHRQTRRRDPAGFTALAVAS